MSKLPPARDTGKRELASGSAPAEVLNYARRGWRVFPCHSAADGRCSCGRHPCGTDNKNAGKHPRTANGSRGATTDERKIRDWAAQWRGSNWAVATGSESGVFVLDVDGERGRTSLEQLEAQYGTLPVTLTSRTGRADGGVHRWFAWPEGCEVRNSQDKVGDKLDVRGAGGYVIASPSVHQTGSVYEWLDPDVPVANPPQWLLDRIVAPTPTRRSDGAGRNLVVGHTYPALFRFGCSLRGRGKSPQEITAELLRKDAMECRPHTESKVRELAASICSQYPPGIPKINPGEPLVNFLRSARDKNNLEFLSLTKRSKWRSPLFVFARLVKGRPEFAGMDGLQAAGRIELELANPWEMFTDVSGDPRGQFIADWEAALTAASESDILTRALDEAQRSPVVPPRAYSDGFCQCMSLLAALQRMVGQGTSIIAAQERIADLLGVHSTMIGKYIRWGVRDGLLTLTEPYVRRERAAEYVFDLSRVQPANVPFEPEVTTKTLTKTQQEEQEEQEEQRLRTVGYSW